MSAPATCTMSGTDRGATPVITLTILSFDATQTGSPRSSGSTAPSPYLARWYFCRSMSSSQCLATAIVPSTAQRTSSAGELDIAPPSRHADSTAARVASRCASIAAAYSSPRRLVPALRDADARAGAARGARPERAARDRTRGGRPTPTTHATPPCRDAPAGGPRLSLCASGAQSRQESGSQTPNRPLKNKTPI